MPAGQAAIQARKKRQKRREKLEKVTLENEVQVEAWMAKYDVSKTGKLSLEEASKLLSDVKRDMSLALPIQPDLLSRILRSFDLNGDKNIERTEVMAAVKKYKALLR